MITCPRCKKQKGLIHEQPDWVFTKNPKDEVIEIQTRCVDCEITFNTKHTISEPVKVYDVEDWR